MGNSISREPSNGSGNSRRISPGGSSRLSVPGSPNSATGECEKKKISLESRSFKKERIIQGRTYHAVEGSSYMLPKDDQEIDRLHDEHFIYKELLGFNVMPEATKTLDFQNKLEILDVCCGPGTWLCEASLEYPNCQFTGIDMCAIWPEVIRPANVEFNEANVLQRLPYPDQSFDFVQMRFVVLAFTEIEWEFVLGEIMRILKDGGCFQCIDLDMHIQTNHETVKSFSKAFELFCSSHKMDASVASKLSSKLLQGKRAGMTILQNETCNVPLGWGGPVGNAYLTTYRGLLDSLAPWSNKKLPSYNEDTMTAIAESKSCMTLHAILVQK